MAWIFDAIDIKWFIDNCGDELKAILDVIINFIKKLFEGGTAEETTEETV